MEPSNIGQSNQNGGRNSNQVSLLLTADNQLNAKPRLSKDVRMQHFQFHKEDAINVNKVYLFRIH